MCQLLCLPPIPLTAPPALFIGKGTTFYSWLDVPSTATSAEISRAYRKKSIQLQYVSQRTSQSVGYC